MKIKTVKKMNLPELIQYVWEKDDVLGEFTSNCGTTLYTSNLGSIRIEHAHKYIGKEELFTVEVEEELTEYTYFKHLMEVTKDNLFEERVGMTIEGAVRPNTSALYIIEGGAFHLIWSRESGIPESGVLEVSE